MTMKHPAEKYKGKILWMQVDYLQKSLDRDKHYNIQWAASTLRHEFQPSPQIQTMTQKPIPKHEGKMEDDTNGDNSYIQFVYLKEIIQC